MVLEIKDLHVERNGQEIIKGFTATFHPGKIYTLMGPNGSGKSTLAYAIMGHPKYGIIQGTILLNGKDITHEKAHLRAKAGLFLSFQYPVEVPGLSLSSFLRTAVNNLQGKKYSVMEFHALLKEKMAILKIDPTLGKRDLNAGFSGGEKKRLEMLQLLLLKPSYALLDETDSGLDVDALKIVAQGIQEARKQKEMAIIVITHYNQFLKYLQPDEVLILVQGKIKAHGGYELAQRIEKSGFDSFINKQETVS